MKSALSPLEFVREYHIRSLACCFSGGKDSLVATHYVLNELSSLDLEKHVIFVDTTVMVPIAIDFVKQSIDRSREVRDQKCTDAPFPNRPLAGANGAQ